MPIGTTRICPEQFLGNTEIQSIILPEGIISIEEYAFANCSELRHIYLPSSLTEIGEGAFLNCSSLESIKLPADIKNLGYDEGSSALETFKGCTNLREIILPDKLETIGESIFEDCKNLTSINIPNGVRYIGSNAFKGCSSLEFINLPTNLSEIKAGAFEDCISLKKIIFHKSLVLGNGAFKGCISLRDIDFTHAKGSTIGERAFAGCISLMKVELDGCYTCGRAKSIFQNCSPDIMISWECMKKDNGFILQGDNWRKINSCLDCQTLIIPDSVTTLGQSEEESDGSFNNYFNRLADCHSLQKVIVPKHVKEIGVGAFLNCRCLHLVIIENPETDICGMAFNDCKSLETIMVPKGYKNTFIKRLQHGELSSLELLVKEDFEKE